MSYIHKNVSNYVVCICYEIIFVDDLRSLVPVGTGAVSYRQSTSGLHWRWFTHPFTDTSGNVHVWLLTVTQRNTHPH